MPHKPTCQALAIILFSLVLTCQLLAVASAVHEDAADGEHKQPADPSKHKLSDAASAAANHPESSLKGHGGLPDTQEGTHAQHTANSSNQTGAEPKSALSDNLQQRKLSAVISSPDVQPNSSAEHAPALNGNTSSSTANSTNGTKSHAYTNGSLGETAAADGKPSLAPESAIQSGASPDTSHEHAAHPEKHKRPPLPIPSPDDFTWEQEGGGQPLADGPSPHEAKPSGSRSAAAWTRDGGPAGGAATPPGSISADTDTLDNSEFDEVPQDPGQRFINLASAADGASVVAVNKEARKPEKTIDGDDDSYMKNQCSAHKWIILELSQLGRVDEVQLLNKEMYSSRVRDFSVKGRQVHPRKDGPAADYPKWFDTEHWQLLGNFTAPNKKGGQSFKMQVARRVRYLLLQFHSHYGSEEMCALNSIRVLGVSAAQELEEALARHLNGVPTLDIPHHTAARMGAGARTVPIVPPTLPAPTQTGSAHVVPRPATQPAPPPAPPVPGAAGQKAEVQARDGTGSGDVPESGQVAAVDPSPDMHCQEAEDDDQQRCFTCMSHAAELLIGAGISMACRPHLRHDNDRDDSHYDCDEDYSDGPLLGPHIPAPPARAANTSTGGAGLAAGDVRAVPVEPSTPPPAAKNKSLPGDKAPPLPTRHHTTIIITPTGEMEAVVVHSEPIIATPPPSQVTGQRHDAQAGAGKQVQQPVEVQEAERKGGSASSGPGSEPPAAAASETASKVEAAAVPQQPAAKPAVHQEPVTGEPRKQQAAGQIPLPATSTTGGAPSPAATSTPGQAAQVNHTPATSAPAPPVTPPPGPPPLPTRPPGYPSVPPPSGPDPRVDPPAYHDSGVRAPPAPVTPQQSPPSERAGPGTEPPRTVPVMQGTEPVLSASYMESLLTTMDGGPAAKPKQSGNLFDLFKQEFVLLRLNQTRMWKYMHNLVEVLNHNAAEAAAEVSALDAQVAELKAKLASVPAQVEAAVAAKLTAAHTKQFEYLAGQISELKQQVKESRLRECALLMYSSCALALLLGVTLGQAGAGRDVEGQARPAGSKLFPRMVMLLGVVNGLIGITLHNPALQKAIIMLMHNWLGVNS